MFQKNKFGLLSGDFIHSWAMLSPTLICLLTSKEVGVNLKSGYNGDLTSREAGSVGGQMVKKMIQAYENGLK